MPPHSDFNDQTLIERAITDENPQALTRHGQAIPGLQAPESRAISTDQRPRLYIINPERVEMHPIAKDIIGFFTTHWPHLLLLIPAVLVFTIVHEFSHCVAAWVQGGTVTEFVWLPTGGVWGYMAYTFPPGYWYSPELIAVAPYVMWLGCCGLAGLLALKRDPYPFWISSSIFVWLFIGPVADIANAAFPYALLNANNDLRDAFGSCTWMVAFGIGLLALIVTGAGYWLQTRLYRDRRLGAVAYCTLAASAVVLAGAITVPIL